MTWRIIMWTLKLLDTECSTAKVLQAGEQLDLYVDWAKQDHAVDYFNRSSV